MKKTNASRLLDQAKVAYEQHEFAASEFTCEEVAANLSIPVNRVWKTLVARGDKTGPVLALLPGDRDLDLKKLARASGNKSCKMVKHKEVEQLTGYLPGGCSPLGQKRRYPVLADESITDHDSVSISAGLRGVQLFVAPEDLVRVAGAAVMALAAE